MTRAIGDLVLAALVVAGAAVLFVGAADLPPPRFEPLGSAALPRILATILIVLAVLVAIRAVLRLRAAAPAPAAESEARPVLGALVFAVLIAYVAALDFGRAPFVPATGVFLGAVGLILSRGSLRAGGVYAVLGVALGAALSFVFSRFLYISIG